MSISLYFSRCLCHNNASGWDTSKVTDMGVMFGSDTNLTNIDGVSNWNTSSLKYINRMFIGNRSLTDISGVRNWNTSSLINMSEAFSTPSTVPRPSWYTGS